MCTFFFCIDLYIGKSFEITVRDTLNLDACLLSFYIKIHFLPCKKIHCGRIYNCKYFAGWEEGISTNIESTLKLSYYNVLLK